MEQFTPSGILNGVINVSFDPNDKVKVVDSNHSQYGRVAVVYKIIGNRISCRDRQYDFDCDISQIEREDPRTELSGPEKHWERGGVRADQDRSINEPGRL